jgi:hypothetical protein
MSGITVKFRLLWKIDLLATPQIGVDLHLELYYDRSIIVIPSLDSFISLALNSSYSITYINGVPSVAAVA